MNKGMGIAIEPLSPEKGRPSTLDGLQILDLEMLIHKCHEFYQACMDLSESAEWLSAINPSNRVLTEDDVASFADAIEEAAKVIEALGIHEGAFFAQVTESRDRVRSISGGLWAGMWEVRANEVASEYRQIRKGILTELARHKFLYLPWPAEKFFRHEGLFGKVVYESFPSARYDVGEAGNAIACELYTAAVFHAMRVAEVGLRALALDRRISHLPKRRDAPIEMGTWEDILKELDQEIEKIGDWPNSLGKIKVQAQEFYGGSVTEFRGFKETWRNHVMHARREYLRDDAICVLQHVGRLMAILGSRISEGTEPTPVIWTEDQLR